MLGLYKGWICMFLFYDSSDSLQTKSPASAWGLCRIVYLQPVDHYIIHILQIWEFSYIIIVIMRSNYHVVQIS